jgi:hypothetical protein
MKRTAWVLLRHNEVMGDVVLGVSMNERVAKQAETNSIRYHKAHMTGEPDYRLVTARVLTKKDVAPRGYAAENKEKS